jgi:hypothetical protein
VEKEACGSARAGKQRIAGAGRRCDERDLPDLEHHSASLG